MTLLEDKNRKYRRWRLSPSEKIQLANNGLQWVLSSNVSAIGIDGEDLIVRFHNGSMYRYYGAGNMFDAMMKSASKGHFVWAKLRKPKVPYKKIGMLPFREDEKVTDDDLFTLIDTRGEAVDQRLREMGMFIPTVTSDLGLIGLNDLLNTR